MKIQVTGSLEDIRKKVSDLRKSIDYDCRMATKHITDPDEQMNAYVDQFRNHSLFPAYNSYLNDAYSVMASNVNGKTLGFKNAKVFS